MSEQTTNSTALKIAENTIKGYHTYKKSVDLITTIATANPVSLAFRGIFLICLTIGMAALHRYIEEVKRQQAKILTEDQRRQLALFIANLESQTSDDVFDVENRL